MYLENPLLDDDENVPQELTASRPIYRPGSTRSQRRLNRLGFDPIGELTKQYQKLEIELEYQENLRSQRIVELGPTGKPRSYRPEIHHAIYDRLTKIGVELLKYSYGKVPDEVIENAIEEPKMVINLHDSNATFAKQITNGETLND